MIITVICELGEYPVELPDTITVEQLPDFIVKYGGIVVPIIEDGNAAARLFIPTGQIQGISWPDGGIVAPIEAPDEDLAEVSYLDEEEPEVPEYPPVDLTPEDPLVPAGKGAHGEVWVDG